MIELIIIHERLKRALRQTSKNGITSDKSYIANQKNIPSSHVFPFKKIQTIYLAHLAFVLSNR